MKIKILAAVVAAIAISVMLPSNALAAKAAPDVSGQKFSDAQAALKTAGFTAVVSGAVGDKLPQSDCIVVRQENVAQRSTPYEVNPPFSLPNSRVLLSLNCNPVQGKQKTP
jgi:hypothetical protein